MEQRAERLRNHGKRYLVGLLAVAGGSIYLSNAYNAKVWYLLAFVCVALLVERFVLPARFPLPQAPPLEE